MSSNLIDYYVINIQSIYDKINGETSLLAKVYPDSFENQKLKINPPENTDGFLNRSVYLWALQAIDDLQTVLDQFLDAFNSQGLYDPQNYHPTERLILWKPRQLVLDSTYQKLLTDNFKKANQLVDALISYAEDATKYIKEG